MPRPRSESQWSQKDLENVARWYFVERRSKVQISDDVGWSRQVVDRMIDHAVKSKLVHTYVAQPVSNIFLQDLSSQLRETFGLTDAILVPGISFGLGVKANEDYRQFVAYSMAQAGAEYVSTRLTNETVVAVGPGHLVKSLVRGIKLTGPLPNLRIVPTTGFTSARHQWNSSNEIAADFKEVTQGTHYWLPVPAMVKDETDRRALLNLSIVKETLRVIEEVNLLIVSLGPITRQKQDMVTEMGLLSAEEMKNIAQRLKETGDFPVCEISYWLLNQEGQWIDAPYKPIGLDFTEIKQRIAERKTRVVGVGGADKGRIHALLSALRGGILTTLVTDHVTAQSLLAAVKH